MIKDKTIICFASSYDAPPTGKHHIMHLLENKNRILWVNFHGSRAPSASGSDFLYMAKKLAEVLKGVKKRKKNLFVITPLVIPLPANEFAKSLNKKLLIFQIKSALKKIARGNVQIWSFTPDISYLLNQFHEEMVVYYCVDDHASFSGYHREQVLRDEKDLCEKSDLVLTTSMALQEAKKGWNKKTILVPHGVDFSHFNRAVTEDLPCPMEIKDIPSPKFGFFGLIKDWVDVDLVAEAAQKKPEWNFIFIGDADSSVDLSKYKGLKNMYFLGSKSYESLPSFCRYFDAALIPFKINKLTLAVNPIKLREYLSAGLPVISTPLPEVRIYDPLVSIVNDSDSFIDAADKILKNHSETEKQKRLNAMSLETWPEKLKRISDAINKI